MDQAMPNYSITDEIKRGEDQFLAGNFQGALEVFESVLQLEPNNVGALNDAGLAAAEMGEPIRAVECFEKALSLEAGNQSAFFNLIDLLIREEAVDLALEVFATYYQGMPDSDELREYGAVFLEACRTTSGTLEVEAQGMPSPEK